MNSSSLVLGPWKVSHPAVPTAKSKPSIWESIWHFEIQKCLCQPRLLHTAQSCPFNLTHQVLKNSHVAITVSPIPCRHRRFNAAQLAGICSEKLKGNKDTWQKDTSACPQPVIQMLYTSEMLTSFILPFGGVEG